MATTILNFVGYRVEYDYYQLSTLSIKGSLVTLIHILVVLPKIIETMYRLEKNLKPLPIDFIVK